MLLVRARKAFHNFSIDVDFTLPTKGITVLFGKSGAGKTTLLNMIAGLVRPDEGLISCGSVRFFDSRSNGVDLPPEQRGLGYVFQQHRLFSHLTVEGNLLFAARYGARPVETARLSKVVAVLGIGHLLERRTTTLSGGEGQRVAIGRALLAADSLLLMDEPLSSLDSERKEEILEYISSVARSFDTPILYVTHAQDEALRLADRVLPVEAGGAGTLESASAFFASLRR